MRPTDGFVTDSDVLSGRHFADGSIWISTVRSRRLPHALCTSTMPPAPICVRISYGPRVLLAGKLSVCRRFYIEEAK